MARRRATDLRFSQPIVLRDGTRLARLSDAAQFLAALPRDRLTGPLFAAGALVSKAVERASARDVENARYELIRAFRAEGWL
jgi:hypothetical protein